MFLYSFGTLDAAQVNKGGLQREWCVDRLRPLRKKVGVFVDGSPQVRK